MIEFVGGIILSIMGLILIWFLRPKVKISPNIIKIKKDNKYIYSIKVINKSYIFQLVDVNFELTMLKPINSPKGMNLALKKIKLKSNHVWFLSRRKFFKKEDSFATYAIIVRIDEDFDLIEKWENENGMFLDLKVIAKNNFSGITSINHRKFNHYSIIKEGYFHHGNSLKYEKK